MTRVEEHSAGGVKAIGVIPARYGSTRFPGKVLALLHNKPLIQHVWEKVSQSQGLDTVIVACDDSRVYDAVKGFGGTAVMTDPSHPSGSDRIAEAIQDIPADIIVNIQGDEPLIAPAVIDALVAALAQDGACPMATVIKKITDAADLSNPNVVKAVTDRNGYALYFSRSMIPYRRDRQPDPADYFKHLGIYAYRRSFLLEYSRWPKSRLEEMEQLEQLRVLEAGYRIRTIETFHDTIGVDTPEDLAAVEKMMAL